MEKCMENILIRRKLLTLAENGELKARAWRRRAFQEKNISFLNLADEAEKVANKFRLEANGINGV